jgi:hypothetical protein
MEDFCYIVSRVSAAKPGNSGVEKPGLSGLSGVSGLFLGVSGVHTENPNSQVLCISSIDHLSFPYPSTYPDGESECSSRD